MAYVASKRSFDEVRHLPSFHALLPGIAKELAQQCAAGDRARREVASVGKPRSTTAFDGDAARTSISDYLVRLCKYGHCSQHTWAVMRVYIERLREVRRAAGESDVNSLNVLRIILSCFVVAAKLRDDVYFANAFYAQVGGVPTQHLNRMEGALLLALDWRTHVEMDELRQYGLLLPAEAGAAEEEERAAAAAEARALRKNAAVPALRAAAERSPAVDDLGGVLAAAAVAA